MAPAPDNLSPPGSSSYSSDTMVVGDGTWDFTTNTFLLPNLVGLNFETMRYNGMGNRFSTVTEYHKLILAHGVIAAIVFLFIIPLAVISAKFYAGSPGHAIRYHAFLQVLAVMLTTVVFALGFFAVGPPRRLTNPHHGIGLAIYVLMLLQAIGGVLVRHRRRHSFRKYMHQCNGWVITLLGMAQVALGLTLYGSPKFTFVLYAIWMTFLLVLFLALNYRHMGRRFDDVMDEGTEVGSRRRRRSRGVMSWAAPLAAGAGIFALLRGRRKKSGEEERKARGASQSRDRSRSRSHVRSRHDEGRSYSRSYSRSRAPEVLSSTRDSEVYEEKYSGRRKASSGASGGGVMDQVLGLGAAIGASALASKFLNRRSKEKRDDESYSAVATDTPSRRPSKRHQREPSDYSDYTEDVSRQSPGRRSPLLPAPARSRTETYHPRPITPRPSHVPSSRIESAVDASDYSSYVSPARRPEAATRKVNTAAGAGVLGGLGGLGLGWFSKKMQDRRSKREGENLIREEEEGRAVPPSAGPRPSRRISKNRPPPSGRETIITEDSSTIEPQSRVPYDPAMPGTAPMPTPVTPRRRNSGSQSRARGYSTEEHVAMPDMPTDPRGILHQTSSSEDYRPAVERRHSRRRSEGGRAAVATAEEERRRRERPRSGEPVSVKVKMHEDRDRNVTLRRLTEEESRREQRRRRRNDSVSSLSAAGEGGGGGGGGGGQRGYRRPSRTRSESRRRAAESAAERAVDPLSADDAPLEPPSPAFAGGKRANKDSAYYSGPSRQTGQTPPTPPPGMATMSSLASPNSHGTWSGLSPNSTAQRTETNEQRRARRRMERGSRPPTTVDFN